MEISTRPGTRFEEVVERARSWWTFRGLLELLTGALALAMPLAATLATTWFLGVLIGLAGVARIVHAARVRKWSGFVVDFVLAVLYLAAAFVTITNPVASTLTLTLLLGSWCIAVGILEVISAVGARPPSWGWLVASGFASVALGVLLISGWPGTALWSIGLLVGATLVANGIGSLAVGLAPRHPILRPPITV